MFSVNVMFNCRRTEKCMKQSLFMRFCLIAVFFKALTSGFLSYYKVPQYHICIYQSEISDGPEKC